MHVFQHNSFAPVQEQALRQSAGPSVYIDNFLSQEEFLFCKELISQPISWPEHGEVSKYWGFGWDSGLGPKLTWLKDKVNAVLDNWELDFLAVQEAINPWKIHADIRWYADKIPYKVILMPMDVEPNSGPVDVCDWPDTYTITFHQRSFLSNWDKDIHGSAQTGNQQSHWVRPCEDPNHENLVNGYQVNRAFWQKYLNHMPYEHTEGMSVEMVHKWKPGSMFFWDSTALHCADNFLVNGIKTKRCLMLFTLLKK